MKRNRQRWVVRGGLFVLLVHFIDCTDERLLGSLFEDSEWYGVRRVLGNLIIRNGESSRRFRILSMIDYCVGNTELQKSTKVTWYWLTAYLAGDYKMNTKLRKQHSNEDTWRHTEAMFSFVTIFARYLPIVLNLIYYALSASSDDL
jgi:hypothetical protein